MRKIIFDAFYKNSKIYGRRRLSQYILKTNSILINSRTIGNYMSALNLKCITRRARKKAEMKNVHTKFYDLVKRNYNQKNVIATDISYISIKSNKSNHAYLSIAINHFTKEIVSWQVSLRNDDQLVLNTLKSIRAKAKTIIHSDHGVQYSARAVIDFLKRKKWQTSMSRVGNCLDNREAEYFFANLKSECLHHIDTKNITINKLKEIITKYIKWYNYERIQKNLNWLSPNQFKENLSKNIL